MNTDNQTKTGVSVQPTTRNAPQSPITDLVSKMQSVNVNTPEARLNVGSISDGKGGRIEFNEDLKGSKVIK